MQIEIIEGRQREQIKLKVCAYCRASTDAEKQENSLENQIAHYREQIQSNLDYEYVEVYSDFAISGYKDRCPSLQKTPSLLEQRTDFEQINMFPMENSQ